MHRGYVKNWRKILEWQWFREPLTAHFFNYLLIKATHKKINVYGIELERGQLIFGRHRASEETGLSHRSIRTAITRLKTTSEMTIKTTNKYSIITLLNYDTYQSDEDKNDQQNDQQNDKQTTNKRPANDHIQTHKNEKNVKNIYRRFTPPTILEVKDFFKNQNGESEKFFDFYSSKGWLVGRSPMKDWRAAARNWLRNKDNFKTGDKKNGTNSRAAEEIDAIAAKYVRKDI